MRNMNKLTEKANNTEYELTYDLINKLEENLDKAIDEASKTCREASLKYHLHEHEPIKPNNISLIKDSLRSIYDTARLEVVPYTNREDGYLTTLVITIKW